MSGRLTAEHVAVVRRDRMPDGRDAVEAHVQGQRRRFVVDFDPCWSPEWLCSCGQAPGCAHVRAVKEALDA